MSKVHRNMLFTLALIHIACFASFSAARTYEDALLSNRNTNHAYGIALYGFWGGIVLCGIIAKLCRVFESRRSTPVSLDSEGQTKELPYKWPQTLQTARVWSRTYLTMPSAFGKHRARLLYWCTIPKRSVAAVIVAYWALSIVLCGTGYEMYDSDSSVKSLTGNSTANQRWKTFADRCAILVLSNLPVVWIFAGRNNVFIWATGWSFQTFNIFHRHVARVAVLQAIGHAAAYTHLALNTRTSNGSSLYHSALKSDWFIWGIVGTTSFGCLWLTSVSWLRRRFYDAFLVIHIGLGIVVIYAIFRHTSKEENVFNSYLWPLVAIWSFDRFLRLVRLIACNLHTEYSKTVFRTNSTTASYDQAADVIKVQIETAGLGMFAPVAGQHCFLYQPFTWKFYENHPFTVGAWSESTKTPAMTEISDAPSLIASKDKRMDSILPVTPTSLSSQATPDQSNPSLSSGSSSLTFWIRPYDGWTRKLRNQCLKSPALICHPHLLVEGPYGHTKNLHVFDTIVFIAGGTGISAILPYIKDHVQRSYQGCSRTTEIRLIWSSRKAGFIQSLCEDELACALSRPDFKLEAYLTDEPVVEQTLLSEGKRSESAPSAQWPSVEWRRGRPDLDEIVQSTAQDLRSGSRAAVFVCGPADMADDARAATHAAMKAGCRGLEYFEDSFGW